MAVRYATANGNWSNPAIWDGGTTIPGAGDTVYANNKTVAIDVNANIGGSNNYDVNAGSFIVGAFYKIKTVGTTDWLAVGAETQDIGEVFLATASGSGTGVATTAARIVNRALASPSIAAGGWFSIQSSVTLTADVQNTNSALNGQCLLFSLSAPSFATVIGYTFGGTAFSNNPSIRNSGSGTLNIEGIIYAKGAIHVANHPVLNASSGTVNFTGSMYGAGPTLGVSCIANTSSGTVNLAVVEAIGGSAAGLILNSSSGMVYGTVGTISSPGSTFVAPVLNSGSGIIDITCALVTGAPSGISSTAVTVVNSSTGKINITGTCKGGGFREALSNIGSGEIYATRACGNDYGIGGSPSTGVAGVFCNNVGKAFVDEFEFGANGQSPTSGCVFVRPASQYQWRVFARPSPGGTPSTLLDASAVEEALPPEADVRNGVGYNFYTRTGTCHVPAATSVAAGVPVDNTVGTAVLTPAAVQAIVGAIVADAIDS